MASAESSDGAVPIRGRAKADATETVGDATPSSGGPPQDIAPASTIGRYVVLDLLGVGGMGVVCTAYDPKLDRKVALKLLRERADAQETHATQGQARLLREAQALAKLSHPNIITVHDVDTFDGQLYMAMEFVEGQTLKEWATEKKHAWREVVDVYIAAGRGLAAAHNAGIIHRDFKPANVLMGNDGRVRVVDFGLAKDKEDKADELGGEVEKTTGSATNLPTDSGIIDMLRSVTDTELTQVGRSVGTPAYMAPEQHMGFGVGAHTDQFSFCVSLFEGLYGQSPFAGRSVEEKFQNIVEGNVREPNKDAQVPQWVHRVLLRGLKSQSQERFPSMDALLAELAKDPARTRRRIAAGVGILGVAGFGVFGAMQASDTSNVCEGSEQRLAGVWDEDRKATMSAAFLATDKPYAADAWSRVEASVDEWATAWATSHVEVCEATHVRGEQSDTLLDVRMSCLDRRLDDVGALMDIFADADAKVVEAAASAAANIADPTACASAEQAPEEHQMPADPSTREAVEDVQRRIGRANALRVAGRYDGARELAEKTAADAAALPHKPTYAEALLAQADAQKEGNDLELARESFVSAIRVSSEAARADLEAWGWIRMLFVVGQKQGKHELGLAYELAADAALTRAGNDASQRASLETAMGGIQFARGEFDEAVERYNKALQLAESTGNDEHVVPILANLGAVYGQTGNEEEARKTLERSLALYEEQVGTSHPMYARTLVNLGHVLINLGKADEACEAYETALAIQEKAFPPDHIEVAKSLTATASAFGAKGKHEEAQKMHERALAIFQKNLGEDHPIVAIVHNNNGSSLRKLGRLEESRVQHEKALAIAEAKLKPDHPRVSASLVHLCNSVRQLGELAKAEPLCARALKLREETKDPDPRRIAEALVPLGQIRCDLGRVAEGVELLERARDLQDAETGTEEKAANTRFALAKALWKLSGRRADALAAANDARAAHAKAGRDEAVADIERWLESHPHP